MSFDENERSVSQNRPIDLYTITTPTVTYRMTSYPVDVSFGGNVFTATTMSRGDQQVTQDPTGRELIVYLPITHPLVQRWAASGIPEHAITVTLQRLQAVSGQAEQQFSGFATGLNVQGHVATLRCPSVTDDALRVRLPVIRAQKLCNHVLFNSRCSPVPGIDGPGEISFSLEVAFVAQAIAPGLVTVTVDSVIGNPDGWFSYGKIAHPATLQKRTILQQFGTLLTIDLPLIGVTPGNMVILVPGCAHDVVTCRDKFSNVKNFGGFPEVNGLIDPWAPKGFGIIQQT